MNMRRLRILCGIITVPFILSLSGCAKKLSGVYEQDVSAIIAQLSDTPNGREGMRGFAAEQGKTHRITFQGDSLELVLGKEFHLRGTFKVSGQTIYVTPTEYGSEPLGINFTNSTFPDRSGRKRTCTMYMPNDDTIIFMTATFRRKLQ